MIKTTDTRPTALDVSLPAGEVIVAVQPGLEYGSVVLEPIRADDEEAAWMIEHAEITTLGTKLVVKVPEKPGAGGAVIIGNVGGSVRISGSSRGSIVVGNGVTMVNGVVTSGSAIQIGTSGVRARIAVPEDVSAKVRGVSTDVRVLGMLADLNVNTTNGDVSSSQHQEDVEIDTTNGTVSLESVGAAEIHTTNGGILVQRVIRKGRLRTTNGSIEATTQTEKFTAKTTNGSCTIVADGVHLDDDAVRTTNGRRRLIRR